MVKAAYKNVPYYVSQHPQGFDTFICDPEKGLFAVFDGMGVSPAARFASEKCAEIVGIGTNGTEDWDMLRMVLLRAIDAVRSNPQAGCTATIVNVDGHGQLQYVHIGDSRLYVLHRDRVKQITADEGVGNMLLNYVGVATRGVCQAGTITKWDKFMLCTDGVTGDWDHQLLSDQTIEQVLTYPMSSVEERCQLALQQSKKDDDKTVIVVERA